MLQDVQLTSDINWHRPCAHICVFIVSKDFASIYDGLLNTQYEMEQRQWHDTLKIYSELLGPFLLASRKIK